MVRGTKKCSWQNGQGCRLMYILQEFCKLLQKKQPSLGSDLESYIISKDPKNIADIEYWQQKWMQEKQQS